MFLWLKMFLWYFCSFCGVSVLSKLSLVLFYISFNPELFFVELWNEIKISSCDSRIKFCVVFLVVQSCSIAIHMIQVHTCLLLHTFVFYIHSYLSACIKANCTKKPNKLYVSLNVALQTVLTKNSKNNMMMRRKP